ncbi:hypothetical protein ACFRMN_00700 [Streptomyces sp. NPDC056835]|uniref:hypothetical protein n=1 Tax=Streptomyces sp. NPDC056835 TaxID=3345956 RepID=UPI0036CABAB5
MRNGGSDTSSDTSSDTNSDSGGLSHRLRKHWPLALGVAVVVLAGAVVIPLAVADGDDESCWRLPASARALADDPAAATKALDPGGEVARLGAAKELLAHERVCGDGARVLGRIVDGATRSTGPGEPHTTAQAGSAYAVASALHDIELPAGLAPGVARMLAEHVVDAGREDRFDDRASGLVVAPEEVRLDENGYVWLGRFLAPGEAHAAFEYAYDLADAEADIEFLVAELAQDPEAFAILYDAQRAYLAHYLERLTDDGGDPAFRASPDKDRYDSDATTWTGNDLEDLANRVGDLMKYRASYARDGTIPDLAAFDASVRSHTRGAFRPASERLDTRPPMGDIARRPVSGPVRGDLMDGRHQLFTVLDSWAAERNVPSQRAREIRQSMDDAYVRALWLR